MQLADDCEERFPKAAAAIRSSMHIDDLIGGEFTPGGAIQLYEELTRAVKEAGLELRKWSTNNETVLQAIPESLREMNPQALHEDQSVKALGIRWHPTEDNFKFLNFNFDNDDVTITKRVLLSNLSRVFDPLGLISCVTVRAKLMLQELWKLSIGWDEAAPVAIATKWKEYREELMELQQLDIPRRITCDQPVSMEIHAFGDASELAYGGIIYLKTTTVERITVNMITSKTRVAPIKPITLPRLELCAALEIAQLTNHVMKVLNLTCPVFYWSDSTITLKWIASPPRRWKTFVCHRVTKIQDLTQIEDWRHVPGTQNPADLASRGIKVEELSGETMWWNGPEWLSQPTLPVFVKPSTSVDDPEERNLPVLVSIVSTEPSIYERFSTLTRLQRVTAYMMRFIHGAKAKLRESGPLQPLELENALKKWIIQAQQKEYSEEIKLLQLDKKIKPSSKLASLHPFVDISGILRVSGRLHNASIPEPSKFPIIIPANSHLAMLITDHFHRVLLHSGFQHTWAAIQSQYWIVRGRSTVRHLVRKCVICRRYRASIAQQLMGSLPVSRVTPSRPFEHCGLDFAGPFTLKNPIGRAPKTYKGYLCIFICMATKAIHLEAVSSLSTEAFLETFRRFISRRGLCLQLFSDCGTNFIGAEKELSTLFNNPEAKERITNELSGQGIKWMFNPPSAPHHGGLWEAGVKSAKFHLRRIIGNGVLTYEQFSTILCQIEGVLNSRPLTPLSTDPTDFGVLTPGHFLIGQPITTLPDRNLTEIPSNRLNHFQLLQQRIQHFWQRWSKEYLHTLQQRSKWRWEKDNVKEGDLVLIVEESSPGTWKRGRVMEVHPGNDGKVRVVTVKTATSQFERPIVKLIPILADEQ